jgi:hypothetical protein
MVFIPSKILFYIHTINSKNVPSYLLTSVRGVHLYSLETHVAIVSWLSFYYQAEYRF